MANAAQILKNRAIAARGTKAAQLKIKHDDAITRLQNLCIVAADSGEEVFRLPHTDQDFAVWASPAGKDYIVSKGFTVTTMTHLDARVLEISWAAPSNEP